MPSLKNRIGGALLTTTLLLAPATFEVAAASSAAPYTAKHVRTHKEMFGGVNRCQIIDNLVAIYVIESQREIRAPYDEVLHKAVAHRFGVCGIDTDLED